MTARQYRLVLLRHGETEWSKSGQHTGRTDLELTDTGREQAKSAAAALADLRLHNPMVISSPRRRARATAELAGLTIDEESPLLAEWDYGEYEGLTPDQIRALAPDWRVWTHGCPGGESPADVTARVDRAIELALGYLDTRDVVFVGHGHCSRSLLTRWVELPIAHGIRFTMETASITVCGFKDGVRQINALGLTSA